MINLLATKVPCIKVYSDILLVRMGDLILTNIYTVGCFKIRIEFLPPQITKKGGLANATLADKKEFCNETFNLYLYYTLEKFYDCGSAIFYYFRRRRFQWIIFYGKFSKIGELRYLWRQ